ncbi:MAG TPA: CRISPR-associated endoribonuclease Cas6 [Clostridiaceae bacterium]|nr:CRISPR-associated endoribonuclease Cas6 [Clostridiaceae bacterium]
MQIKLSFSSEKDIILPIHYNNLIQAFIYNNIDKRLAAFLHEYGYISNGRSFKLFSFSNILCKGKKEEQSFSFGKKIEFVVASPLEYFCKSIANYMLQRDILYLGQNYIKTEQMQVINKKIEKDEIVIKTLSPIVAYSTLIRPDGRKYTCYFRPEESDFSRIITENLVKKYNVLSNDNLVAYDWISFTPVGRARQNLVYYKDTVIKGATGKFIVKGDKKLLQVGIDTGFGSKNSQGFGCVEIV